MNDENHKKHLGRFYKICSLGKCFYCNNSSLISNFSIVEIKKMIIGSILEDKNLDQRIAITPDIIKKYKSLGIEYV